MTGTRSGWTGMSHRAALVVSVIVCLVFIGIYLLVRPPMDERPTLEPEAEASSITCDREFVGGPVTCTDPVRTEYP